MDLKGMSTRQLLALHAEIGDELRARAVVRSANNPTGDLAEFLFCTALGWAQAPASARGFDALGPDGTRYQIKARRHHALNRSRQVSALRNLASAEFDVLAGVIFDHDYSVLRAALVPHALVAERSRFPQHTNSHLFLLTDDIWDPPGVRDVTAEIAAAMP